MVFSTPQGHRKPCGIFFTLDFFRNHNVTTPQPHRNVTVRRSHGGLAMAYGFYPVLEAYKFRTAASRRPCGGPTAPFLRQSYGKLVVAAITVGGLVRSPYGLLVVTLLLFDFMNSSIAACGRRNICNHNYHSPQDLTIFKNHILQTVDHETARRPYMASQWGHKLPSLTRCNL